MLARAFQSLSLAELQAERASCLSALLALVKGTRATRLTHDGKTVEYAPSPSARADLEALIGELDAAIALKTTGRSPRRPIHPVY